MPIRGTCLWITRFEKRNRISEGREDYRRCPKTSSSTAGGVGVGLYPDFSMAETMNKTVEVIDPDPATQAAYEKFLPIFEATYQALVPIYDMISEVNP